MQAFNTRPSPVFPNNQWAQLALASIPGATTNYPGNSNVGPAFAGRGQLEYAIDNGLSVGIAGSVNNVRNYTEGIGKVYFRQTFGGIDSSASPLPPLPAPVSGPPPPPGSTL